ncbi:hypothetical protein Tco_0449921 [Tanacetum coccineum]
MNITADDVAPPYSSGGCSTSESSDFRCSVKRCRFDDDFDRIVLRFLTKSVDDPLLETERDEVHVSSDELAESSEDMDLVIATEAEIERKDIYLTGDFLSSGAALWEHPNKNFVPSRSARYFLKLVTRFPDHPEIESLHDSFV